MHFVLVIIQYNGVSSKPLYVISDENFKIHVSLVCGGSEDGKLVGPIRLTNSELCRLQDVEILS